MRVYTHRSPNMGWCYIMRPPGQAAQHYKVPKRPTGWAEREWYAGRLDNLQPVAADLVPGILRQVGAPVEEAA